MYRVINLFRLFEKINVSFRYSRAKYDCGCLLLKCLPFTALRVSNIPLYIYT